jgi:hypothetical protein
MEHYQLEPNNDWGGKYEKAFNMMATANINCIEMGNIMLILNLIHVC